MASVQVQKATEPSFSRLEPGSVNILPHKFNATSTEPSDATAVAKDIIDAFGAAIAKEDPIAVADLFADDSFWRDHLALTWDVRTFTGKDQIKEHLTQNGCGLTTISIDDSSAYRAPHFAPFDGAGNFKGIEFFINFETKLGRGRGTCRLFEENAKYKIFSIFTSLQELKGHEPAAGFKRPQGVQHGGNPERKNWMERRTAEKNYDDGSEPTVIILGE
jgi:hypothetical protein